MKLEFTYKNDFGRERFYAHNSSSTVLLSIMPRRSCFKREDLEKLKTAGYEIEVLKDKVTV